MKVDYSRISLDSILEREVDSETFTNLAVKLREAHSQSRSSASVDGYVQYADEIRSAAREGIAADWYSNAISIWNKPQFNYWRHHECTSGIKSGW